MPLRRDSTMNFLFFVKCAARGAGLVCFFIQYWVEQKSARVCVWEDTTTNFEVFDGEKYE